MIRNTLMLVIGIAMGAVCGFSATPPIGVVSGATFSLDNVAVARTAPLLAGMELATSAAPSDVTLTNGASVRLDARSAGVLYEDHLVLQRGAVSVSGLKDYCVQAGEVQIQSEQPETRALVRLDRDTIAVASLGGEAQVRDIHGVLLAQVGAGTRVAFRQSGATAASQHRHMSQKKVLVWAIALTSGAAIGLGIAALR